MNWGEVKGAVRHIFQPSKDYALYMIEEPPGRKTVLFKKGRYEVLCPWLYFFVKVDSDGHVPDNHAMVVFLTRRQIEGGTRVKLFVPPFPNTSKVGVVCLPEFVTRESHDPPVKAAFTAIDVFWRSKGNEFDTSVPTQLGKGFFESKGNYGTVFRNWSKLSYREAVNVEWRELEYDSLDSMDDICALANSMIEE